MNSTPLTADCKSRLTFNPENFFDEIELSQITVEEKLNFSLNPTNPFTEGQLVHYDLIVFMPTETSWNT